MELEDLFYNQQIDSIDSFHILVRKIIEEIAKKNQKTAFSLNNLLALTNSEEATFQSAKVITKYNNYTAERIAYTLTDVARYTKDKDAVIESTKLIGRYDEDTAEEILYPLNDIAMNTEDKDAVIESIKTLSKYGNTRGKSIFYALSDIARNTKDKDAVIESIKTLSKHNKDIGEDIVYMLSDIAVFGDEIDIKTACSILNKTNADVLDILEARDFIEIRNRKLDDLINSKESFDAIAAYIKSDFILPTPNKENIASYKNITYDYIYEEYKISRNLNTNQILMLFSPDKDKRKELTNLINNSSEKGLKMYSIATEETKRLEMDKSKLPYLSIIAVTESRDSALDNEAYSTIKNIVGEKTVRKARNEFKSNYRNKIKEIANYVNKGEINKAIDSLKTIKNGSIEDVLSCANYSDLGFTNGKAVLSAVESNNPLDYDNRIQIACVYLPNDYHDGIYNYCRDYYSKEKGVGFILVRYDIGGKTLGSAICYMEKNTFLVDSVEGHRTFRKPQIFKAVYQDLVERAREKGAEKVIFSENCMNETPKKFIEFLGNFGLKKGNVDMKLNTEGYLEAEKENVKGYIVNLD